MNNRPDDKILHLFLQQIRHSCLLHHVLCDYCKRLLDTLLKKDFYRAIDVAA